TGAPPAALFVYLVYFHLYHPRMTRFARGVRLGIVRGIHYGLFAPPEPFVPQARALGARLVRAYLYWSQVEPRPGEFVFDTLDTLLDQLYGDVEVWLTLCS